MSQQDAGEPEESDEEPEVEKEKKVREELAERDELGELKEHMILDAEAARVALEHEPRLKVLHLKPTEDENWNYQGADHGFTIESLQPEPLPAPEVDDTDTDIGESDFVRDIKHDEPLPPGAKLINELKEPKAPHPEDDLVMHPILSPENRATVYDALQVLVNMPQEGEVKRWRKSISPDHIDLILQGARRAGISKQDFQTLKTFLQDQRDESNELLEKFRHIVTPEFRNKLKSIIELEESTEKRNVFKKYLADGTPVLTETKTKSHVKELKSPFDFDENSEFPDSDPDLEDLNDEYDLAESPMEDEEDGGFSEDDEEIQMDDAESQQTSNYFIDYAFRIKKLLDYQMREQLMEFGLIGGIDERYRFYDPPELGKDLDPCVEIIHVSHIQSLTKYDRLEHVQRKVVFKIKMAYLNFPAEVLERFKEIVGKRYNPDTGVFKFVSQAHHNKHQNTIHGIRQIRKLFEASFDACPYYLPINETSTLPEETVADCPVTPKVYEMYETPYIRAKPWLPETMVLKPRNPYYVFRVFPFGWSNTSTENVATQKQ